MLRHADGRSRFLNALGDSTAQAITLGEQLAADCEHSLAPTTPTP